MVHELRITNQVIYLNPPIEECRYKLYQEMFAWKMVVLSLPRIQSQRYQVSPCSRPRRPLTPCGASGKEATPSRTCNMGAAVSGCRPVPRGLSLGTLEGGVHSQCLGLSH